MMIIVIMVSEIEKGGVSCRVVVLLKLHKQVQVQVVELANAVVVLVVLLRST